MSLFGVILSIAHSTNRIETEMVVDEIDPVVQRLRQQGIRFVSPRVCSFSDERLGFEKAVMALDPDGHAILLIEKVDP